MEAAQDDAQAGGAHTDAQAAAAAAAAAALAAALAQTLALLDDAPLARACRVPSLSQK